MSIVLIYIRVLNRLLHTLETQVRIGFSSVSRWAEFCDKCVKTTQKSGAQTIGWDLRGSFPRRLPFADDAKLVVELLCLVRECWRLCEKTRSIANVELNWAKFSDYKFSLTNWKMNRKMGSWSLWCWRAVSVKLKVCKVNWNWEYWGP